MRLGFCSQTHCPVYTGPGQALYFVTDWDWVTKGLHYELYHRWQLKQTSGLTSTLACSLHSVVAYVNSMALEGGVKAMLEGQ